MPYMATRQPVGVSVNTMDSRVMRVPSTEEDELARIDVPASNGWRSAAGGSNNIAAVDASKASASARTVARCQLQTLLGPSRPLPKWASGNGGVE